MPDIVSHLRKFRKDKPLKSVEFTVSVCFKNMVALLDEISETSFFQIDPERFGKSSSRIETYRILFCGPETKEPEAVGLIEIKKTRQRVTTVKIREKIFTQLSRLPTTGSPLTRFIGLFAQRMLSSGLISPGQ